MLLSRCLDSVPSRTANTRTEESAREVKGDNPSEIAPQRCQAQEHGQAAEQCENQQVVHEYAFFHEDMNLSDDT